MKKNTKYDRMCAYCEKAVTLFDEDAMLCKKKGVVSRDYKCTSFVYDPLKRQPPRAVNTPKLEFIDID